ncbi:uncharacterized protein LOC120090859 [Benincasa hispida]|uniref:uncharacterized protein LOC120090859 n=1 Tax=Benincasa hispida TaxID=102211 RepID=UPI0019021E32|nr:uncharacterized protein LOC120090859 [Benincasa hispida]
MGKSEEEQTLPVGVSSSELSDRNVESRCGGGGCSGIRRLIAVRCVFFLLLSVAVFLSAIFWLPPFLSYGNWPDRPVDSAYRDHEIVASFHAWKPAPLLENHIFELEDNIFGEIPVPFVKVAILSLQSLGGPNATKIVFAVDSDAKYSKIPPTSQSLIKETFETLVINDPPLRLNASLFGNTSLFEVLKFPGGITIIPPQSAFLLQTAQIYFNFTLNYSIYQIQVNFDDLTSQLRSGLHLSPYENLYVSLSNERGSTMHAPTIVQSSVLMAIGTNSSKQRLKQLAQTITNSHSRNLGLNNTIFGKVKQVRLSSVLNHSLGGGGSARETEHTLKNGVSSAPEAGSSPVESPTSRNYEATPPAFQYGYKRSSRKVRKQAHLGPIPSPSSSPASPYLRVGLPAPVSDSISASSPLSGVVLSNVQPPNSGSKHAENFGSSPSVLPPQFSSSVGVRVYTIRWTLALFLLVWHVQPRR